MEIVPAGAVLATGNGLSLVACLHAFVSIMHIVENSSMFAINHPTLLSIT